MGMVEILEGMEGTLEELEVVVMVEEAEGEMEEEGVVDFEYDEGDLFCETYV